MEGMTSNLHEPFIEPSLKKTVMPNLCNISWNNWCPKWFDKNMPASINPLPELILTVIIIIFRTNLKPFSMQMITIEVNLKIMFVGLLLICPRSQRVNEMYYWIACSMVIHNNYEQICTKPGEIVLYAVNSTASYQWFRAILQYLHC